MIIAADYYKKYIDNVKDVSLAEALNFSKSYLEKTLAEIPIEKYDYAYTQGKWTIKQVLIHLIDTERVMACRALRIGRGDQTPLPGFDQDAFMKTIDASKKSFDKLVQEYEAQRASTILLFSSFTQTDLDRVGNASNKEVSCEALGYIIAGHDIHHCEVINEKYLL